MNKRIKSILYVLVVLLLLGILFFKIEEIYNGITTLKQWLLAPIYRMQQAEPIDLSGYEPLEDEDDAWYMNTLIAHGCGGIDGRTYTNSSEALALATDNGYKLIEIDFSITNDNHIICYHSWDYGIDYNDFMNSSVEYLYTPMDIEDVLIYLSKYPDVYVITDMKCLAEQIDTSIIQGIVNYANNNGYADQLQQFIIQIYYQDDLNLVQSIYPFDKILYTQYMNDCSTDQVIAFCLEHDIHAIALNEASIYDDSDISQYNAKNIHTYAFTVNDMDRMKELHELGVNGFYTDYVRPDDLKYIGL